MTDDTHPRRNGPQTTTDDHADDQPPDERAVDAELVDKAGEARDANQAERSDGADAPAADDGAVPPDDSDAEKIRRYLLKGALGVLALLGVVATFQFYTSATAAIDVLVADEFQPIFQAVFNLIVLLGAGLGIAQVVRELG